MQQYELKKQLLDFVIGNIGGKANSIASIEEFNDDLIITKKNKKEFVINIKEIDEGDSHTNLNSLSYDNRN